MHKMENRKAWIGLLAKAPADRLAALWNKVVERPGFTYLRRPEIGGAMVRGRMGGTGAAFNLGEMTVTRCSVQINSGEVGHGYVQGRDMAKAETAALIDALMQTHAAEAIRDTILTPLQAEMETARTARAAKAAATKVDFFTMVRGED
ncbi:phosphonate C-P lyase system protein PhnG [Thalassovita sp.]|uniref:phosphonate C-P lyase system protein PhnG n=1 Tax=Thalassovita sp. TaxID=1979401 RepID=UPI002B26F0CD|nr:phosphonate C-P lyase system protein PhnG [Thalassovita sp.]